MVGWHTLKRTKGSVDKKPGKESELLNNETTKEKMDHPDGGKGEGGKKVTAGRNVQVSKNCVCVSDLC